MIDDGTLVIDNGVLVIDNGNWYKYLGQISGDFPHGDNIRNNR